MIMFITGRSRLAQAHYRGKKFPCAIGFGGIRLKTQEGDGVTPVGIWQLTERYFRADRQPRQRAIPILPSMGWSDDPKDPAYNQQIRRPYAFSHEALRRADRAYDLIGVMDFNTDPIHQGKGSAVFLHIWRGRAHPTAGCIAFSAEHTRWILEHWQPQDRIKVL